MSAGEGAAARPPVLDLDLVPLTRFRPVELVSPGFVAVDLEGDDVHTATRSATGPAAPYAAVEVTLAPDARAGVVAFGLASDDAHVLAVVDVARRTVVVEVRSGATTRSVPPTPRRLSRGDRLAVTVCENRVTVLVRHDGVWRPVVSERRAVLRTTDLRDPATCGALRYAWEVRRGAPDVLTAVRAGVFGMTGLRDLHLVQHADGSPYLEDGRLCLTASCAGTGGFRQGHWGVFTLDPEDPTGLVPTAHLFSRRDGLLLGDHAGQLVRDGDDWLVMTSAWGDFEVGTERRRGSGVHVRHLRTTGDLLHGVHVLETERSPLPTWHSTWDPSYTRIDGRWHVAYVESRSQRPFHFHPALAVGPEGADPWESLVRVGGADRLSQCEGPVLAQVDGQWAVLASDGKGRRYPVYDLAMRPLGRLRAPYPTNIPHPQLVPRPDGSWLMITFDGTPFVRTRTAGRMLGYGTHGDVHVLTTRRTGP